jgi:aminoglycoside phosphotransferase (APT) family kinase protein
MESITKNRQSEENIVRMLRKAFGSDITSGQIKIQELTEGFFNVAYEIQLPEKSIILKIAPQKDLKIMTYETDIMKTEVAALRLVKQKTQVPVPEVLYYDDSCSLCDAEYFFMEKLEGDSFFKLKNQGLIPYEQQNEIYHNIGRFNHEMNQLGGEFFGYIGLPEKQGKDWKQVFLTMMEDVLKDGERIEISLTCAGYDEVRKLIEQAGFSLSDVKAPSFVHWDLWDGNVFVKDGRITGIIDFERAVWAEHLMEFNFRGHINSKDFYAGYGKNLREEAPIRALLYDMYLFLIMTIETKYRKYPDNWQYDFSTKQLSIAINKLKQLI